MLGQEREVAGDAEQGEAGHQHAGDGARLEGEVEALGQALLRGDLAVRTLARTETFMPMKPAAPESTAPIRKPTAASLPRRMNSRMRMTTPTMAMVVYWRRR